MFFVYVFIIFNEFFLYLIMYFLFVNGISLFGERFIKIAHFRIIWLTFIKKCTKSHTHRYTQKLLYKLNSSELNTGNIIDIIHVTYSN